MTQHNTTINTNTVFSKLKQFKYWSSLTDIEIAFLPEFESLVYDLPRNSKTNIQPAGFFIYKDNGSDILAVCHLDTVLPYQDIKIDNHKITSTTLDDRLGLFTILEILPVLGINVDWLFTTNEEIGKSTAQYFDTNKRYNWIVEFDRHGTGVVGYQYLDEDFVSQLKESWDYVGRGTFTDIGELDHLGCKAFNVAVAYYHEHMPSCYVNVKEYAQQINKFTKFYWKHHTTHFPHTQGVYVSNVADDDYSTFGYWGRGSYYGADYDWESDGYWNKNQKYLKSGISKTPTQDCIFCGGDCTHDNKFSKDYCAARAKSLGLLELYICQYDVEWLVAIPNLIEQEIIIKETIHATTKFDTIDYDRDMEYCANCSFQFQLEEMMHIEDVWLCPDCHDLYVRILLSQSEDDDEDKD